MTVLEASEIIRFLGLEPHPEGGHYCQTFRDTHMDADGRPASTAIYFLLARGERSHWHRVDATETWLFHAGAPLALRLADGNEITTIKLGIDLRAGERPQAVVPTGVWQAADTLGDWTLVSCTVAPGFVWGGFELAPKDWSPDKP
jgi:predicted cupin superfamily sugar epimerase